MAENEVMGGGQGADYSLKTQILMDFAQSAQAADGFSKLLGEISASVSGISEATKTMNVDFADRISKSLDKLTSLTVPKDQEEAYANAIRQKIQKAVHQSILRAASNISVKTEGDMEETAIEVKLNKDQWEGLVKNFRNQMVERMKQFKIQYFHIPPIKLSPTNIKAIREQFSTKLSEALNKRIVFDFESEQLDAGGKKIKMQVPITASHIQTMLNVVSSKFHEVLSKPETYDIGTFDGIKVDRQRINEAVEKIKKVLGDFDKDLNLPIEAIEKIPPIDRGLNNFRTRITAVIKEVNDFNSALDKVGLPVDDEKYAQLRKSVLETRSNVIKTLATVLEDVNKRMAESREGQVDWEEFNKYTSNITTTLNGVIKDHLDAVIVQINEGFGMERKSVDGKEVWVPSVKKIEDVLVRAVGESLGNLSAANLIIDTKPINMMLKIWTELMATQLQTVVQQALAPLDSDFVEAQKVTIRTVVQNTKNAFSEALRAFTLTEAVMATLGKQFHQAVETYISKINLNVTEENVINLDKAVKSANERVIDAVKQCISTWKPQKDVPVDIDLNAIVATPIRKAITTVVGQYTTQLMSSEALGKMVASKVDDANLPVVAIDQSKLTAPLSGAVNTFLGRYVDTISTSISNLNTQGIFSIMTRDLSSEVRRSLAAQAGKSVRDWEREQGGVMSGDDAMQKVLTENINVLLKRFHKTVQKGIGSTIDQYEDALRQVEIRPDMEAVHYFTSELTSLQRLLTNKIKEVLTEQFQQLAAEIQGIRLFPTSISDIDSTKSLSQAVDKLHQRIAKIDAITQVEKKAQSFGIPSYNARTSRPYSPVAYPAALTPKASSGSTPFGKMQNALGNTVRYITAGALIGMPITYAQQAFKSSSDFEYDLTMARQNFLMKDYSMEQVAARRVKARYENADRLGDYGVSREQYEDVNQRNDLIRDEAKSLKYMTKEGVIKPLQNMALFYGINQESMGQVWQIASRNIDDPYEALSFTQAASKLYSYESDETTPDAIAKGLQSVAAQWGLKGQQLDQVSNMAIKVASLSQATAQELLDVQSRSGAIFARNMPDVPKDEALATSMVLSSLFLQSTARSGDEGGTFWKNVFASPFGAVESKWLEEKSRVNPEFAMLNPYKEVPGTLIKEQKSGLDMFLDIMEAQQKMDDASRKELLDVVYKRRSVGSVEAINAMLAEMANSNESVSASGADNVRELIKQTMETTGEEVFRAIAERQDTWKYRTQKVTTAWQTTSYDIVDGLKGEFTVVSNYLVAFLRMLKNNAQGIADLITFATKMLVGNAIWKGIKYMHDEGEKLVETRRIDKLQNAYNQNRYFLGEEQRALELKRQATIDKMIEGKNTYALNAAIQKDVKQQAGQVGSTLEKLKVTRDAEATVYNQAMAGRLRQQSLVIPGTPKAVQDLLMNLPKDAPYKITAHPKEGQLDKVTGVIDSILKANNLDYSVKDGKITILPKTGVQAAKLLDTLENEIGRAGLRGGANLGVGTDMFSIGGTDATSISELLSIKNGKLALRNPEDLLEDLLAKRESIVEDMESVKDDLNFHQSRRETVVDDLSKVRPRLEALEAERDALKPEVEHDRRYLTRKYRTKSPEQAIELATMHGDSMPYQERVDAAINYMKERFARIIQRYVPGGIRAVTDDEMRRAVGNYNPDSTTRGVFLRGGGEPNRILINSKRDAQENLSSLIGTIAHELRHAVDTGRNGADWVKQQDDLYDDAFRVQKTDRKKGYNMYLNIPSEVNARSTGQTVATSFLNGHQSVILKNRQGAVKEANSAQERILRLGDLEAQVSFSSNVLQALESEYSDSPRKVKLAKQEVERLSRNLKNMDEEIARVTALAAEFNGTSVSAYDFDAEKFVKSKRFNEAVEKELQNASLARKSGMPVSMIETALRASTTTPRGKLVAEEVIRRLREPVVAMTDTTDAGKPKKQKARDAEGNIILSDRQKKQLAKLMEEAKTLRGQGMDWDDIHAKLSGNFKMLSPMWSNFTTGLNALKADPALANVSKPVAPTTPVKADEPTKVNAEGLSARQQKSVDKAVKEAKELLVNTVYENGKKGEAIEGIRKQVTAKFKQGSPAFVAVNEALDKLFGVASKPVTQEPATPVQAPATAEKPVEPKKVKELSDRQKKSLARIVDDAKRLLAENMATDKIREELTGKFRQGSTMWAAVNKALDEAFTSDTPVIAPVATTTTPTAQDKPLEVKKVKELTEKQKKSVAKVVEQAKKMRSEKVEWDTISSQLLSKYKEGSPMFTAVSDMLSVVRYNEAIGGDISPTAPVAKKKAEKPAKPAEPVDPLTERLKDGYDSDGNMRFFSGDTPFDPKNMYLRVAATKERAAEMYDLLSPVLKANNIHHQVIRSTKDLEKTNPNNFMTIMPKSVEQAVELATYMDSILKDKGFTKVLPKQESEGAFGEAGVISYSKPKNGAVDLFNPPTLTDDELNNKKQKIADIDAEIAKLDSQLQQLLSSLQSLGNDEKNIEGALTTYQKELEGTDDSISKVVKRAELMDVAFDEMGMGGRSFGAVAKQIAADLKVGKFSVEGYEQEIRQMALAHKVSEKDMIGLRGEIERLMGDFSAAKISAQEFAGAIRNLEVKYKIYQSGVVPTGKIGQATGGDLVDMLVADSMYRKQMLGKDNIQVSDKKGGVKDFAGNIVGGLASMAKGQAEIWLLMSLMETILDPIASAGLLPSERMENESAKRRDLAKRFSGLHEAENGGIGGHIRGALSSGALFFGGLFNGLTNLFGGTAPSFGDYFKAAGAYINYDGSKEDLDTRLKEALGYEDKMYNAKKQAEIEQLEEFKNNKTLDLDGDGKKDDTWKRNVSEIETLEEGQQMISRTLETLSMSTSKLNSEMSIKQAQLLTQGVREDSEQMSQLMQDFLTRNIQALETAVAEIAEKERMLRESRPDYASSEAWKVVNDNLLQKQAELEAARLKKIEEDFSKALSRINHDMDYGRSMARAKTNAKMDDLILQGYTDDSPAIKSLEKSLLQEENSRIATAIEQFNEELKGANGDRRDELLLKIAQLQAESKDNLVKIYKLMPQRSTFNLPSDIRPLTYWEAKAGSNTHQNMTASLGDINVNVTIDNMSGNQEDVQRVTDAVGKAVRDAQAELASVLNRSVRSGAGRNYQRL